MFWCVCVNKRCCGPDQWGPSGSLAAFNSQTSQATLLFFFACLQQSVSSLFREKQCGCRSCSLCLCLWIILSFKALSSCEGISSHLNHLDVSPSASRGCCDAAWALTCPSLVLHSSLMSVFSIEHSWHKMEKSNCFSTRDAKPGVRTHRRLSSQRAEFQQN